MASPKVLPGTNPQEERAAERLSVEELSRRTGMTVSNLRALQARGLLDPPELVGRKGFYTERHLARVALVRRLQDRGFSLVSIRELVRGWTQGSGILELAGFEDVLTTPFTASKRVARPVADVFPELLEDPATLKLALAVELVVREGGEYIAPNAEMLGIVRAHVEAGFPLASVLEDSKLLLEDVERIAARFRKSFSRHIVDEYARQGFPAGRIGELGDKIARLRPLGVRAVAILLGEAIERGGPRAAAAAGTPAASSPSRPASPARPAGKRAPEKKRAKARSTAAKRRA